MVSRAQLLGIGLSENAIESRIRTGRIYRLHRGVYAVGHWALTRSSHLLAAALAVGDDAAISHATAADVWGIRPSSSRRIEVTAPRALKKRQGMLLHRLPLPSDEVVVRAGIPVTSVHRTLIDVACSLRDRDIDRAMEQAAVLRLDDALPLVALFDRYPTRRGTAKLARAVERLNPRFTRRELERRFLEATRKAGLPLPQTNSWVCGYEVDVYWPSHGLVVELDSHQFHLTPQAFERDRERDRALTLAGYRVLRVTWYQVDAGIRDVAAVLARSPLSLPVI